MKRLLRKTLLTGLGVLLFGQAALGVAAADDAGTPINLVPNGGFESGPWPLEGTGQVETDGDAKVEGSFSVKMTATGQSQIMVSDPIRVDPQTHYLLSAMVRSDAIEKIDGIFIGVLEVREDNSAVGWYRSDRLMTTGGTHDWKPLSAALEGLNADTAFVKLYLRMDPGVNGTAWFDDVRLTAADEGEESIAISLRSAKLGNIFDHDEEMTALVTVKNGTQQQQQGLLQFTLKDYWGTVVMQESQDIVLPPGAEHQMPVTMKQAGIGYFAATAAFQANGGSTSSTTATFARIMPHNPAEMPDTSFFGSQTHFGQYKADAADNLSLISAMGSKFIRDEMYWSEVEKEKGQFVFDPRFDTYVNEAAQRGIEPILILNYGNILYDKNPETGYFRSPHTREGLEAYSRYVKEVASRYKGKIHHYEVWNEPNGRQFWLAEPDAREYAAVLKAAYLSVKEVDPEAVVIAGAIAGTDLYFLDDLFAAGGLNYMDALSIHPYRGGSPEYTNYLADIERHRKLMMEYGQIKKLWITETGYPTTEEYYSPEEQARYVVRTHVQSMSSGMIRMIDWYDFQDDGPDPHNHEHNFGLVRPDLTPKPSYAAYNAMVHQLNGAVYIGQIPLAIDQYGYVFLRNGRLTTVLWSMRDSRIELAYEGDYMLTDMLGALQQGSAGGRLAIDLKPEPVYLQTQLAAGWAKTSAAYALKGDLDKAVSFFDETVKDQARLEKWKRFIADAALMVDSEKYLQGMKTLSELQRDVLMDGGKAIALKDAYAISSTLTAAQQKLSGIQYAEGSSKPVESLEQQADRMAKRTDRLEESLRVKTGETGRLPSTELWISEVRDQITQARVLLRDNDAGAAEAVLAYAQEILSLAEVSGTVEQMVDVPVWTSLSKYEWSGEKKVSVPVSIHNELDRAVIVTPKVETPEEQIHADVMPVTLAAGESSTVNVEVDGSAVAAGRYPASLTLLYTDAGGREAASVPMDFTLNFVKPVEFAVEPLTASFLQDGKMKVTVRNLLDQPVTGSFRVTLPEQYQSDSGEFTVQDLQAGETRSYDMVLRQAASAPLNEYTVNLKGQFGGSLVEASKPMNFEYSVKGTAAVDGDLLDWSHALPVHLSDESKVHMIGNWTPDKVSATLWTMWDDSHFYLAAKVTDNRFYNAYTEGEVWRGDGIQAAFDTLGDETSSYNADDYEYGFSLTPSGEQAFRWAAAAGRSTGLVPSAQVAVKPAADGSLIYEIAIPKDEIAPLHLQAGTVFGMNLLVNDNDEGERLGWLEWTEGLGMYKNPSMFHKWTLVE